MKRLLFLLFLLAACTHQKMDSSQTPFSNPTLAILLMDSHPEPLSPTQKLTLSISQVYLHGEDGWQTLTQNARRYDLARLHNTQQNKTLYDTLIPPGHYDQVKLYLTQVSITQKNKNQVAYLPSTELTIPIELEAKKDHIYTLLLNFNTLQSIYTAKYNEYVFAPQLEVELHDTSPDQEERLLDRYLLGMDEQGNVEKNAHIQEGTEFRIVNNKIKILQPLLQDSGAGINFYLQSIPFESETVSTQVTHPIRVTLKEIRLQNNNTVTVYKGEQELLLDPNYVQEVASEQVPAEEYTQLKLYFEDSGEDERGGTVELTPSILIAFANLTTQEDQTLNVFLQVPVSITTKGYRLHTPQITTTTEKSIRTDAAHTGQKLYIPHADLAKIREADGQGLFKN